MPVGVCHAPLRWRCWLRWALVRGKRASAMRPYASIVGCDGHWCVARGRMPCAPTLALSVPISIDARQVGECHAPLRQHRWLRWALMRGKRAYAMRPYASIVGYNGHWCAASGRMPCAPTLALLVVISIDARQVGGPQPAPTSVCPFNLICWLVAPPPLVYRRHYDCPTPSASSAPFRVFRVSNRGITKPAVT